MFPEQCALIPEQSNDSAMAMVYELEIEFDEGTQDALEDQQNEIERLRARGTSSTRKAARSGE